MKILIIIVMLCLMGCRTVKTTTKARGEMKKDIELNTVAVKAGTRETNTMTYWPDGSVYQFEQLRERVDDVELARLNVEEKQLLKRDEVLKEREPLKVWVYLSIAAVAIAAVMVYWKIKN